MLVRTAVLGLILHCATLAAAEEPLSSLSLSTLPAGQVLEIHTADRVLRGSLVDPRTGEAAIRASQDGSQFGAERRVYLLGATQGPQTHSGGLSLVMMHEIRTGMRIEIGLGSLDAVDRRVTSPVSAIKLLSSKDAVAVAN